MTDSLQISHATPLSPDVLIRDGADGDSWDVIGLVAACWSEYPNCVLDVDGEVPYLRAVASAFAGWGGRFWVAEDGGRAVACVGCAPGGTPDELELRMLYVGRRWRKRGLGERLAALVEAEAEARAATSIVLWSDTRFEDAHRLYERLGYTRGPTRELHDLSKTVEYQFRKAL
jgi:putative acetyltransferase